MSAWDAATIGNESIECDTTRPSPHLTRLACAGDERAGKRSAGTVCAGSPGSSIRDSGARPQRTHVTDDEPRAAHKGHNVSRHIALIITANPWIDDRSPMHCPTCNKSSTLKPVKLNGDLPARECAECHGILIDLLSYRAWREHRQEQQAESPAVVDVSDNARAMLCPKCSRLMLKFRIGGETRNAIDVCLHCDEAWLDQGEWELLGALALQSKLTNIFTEPWQRRIKAEQNERFHAERNEALIGKTSLERIDAFLSWVEDHPNRDEVLRILRQKI